MIKSKIREEILQKRNSLTNEDVEYLSNKIKQNLYSIAEFKSAKRVMFYVSFNNEVYTHSMIREALKKKIVIVPKILNMNITPCMLTNFNELEQGNYKILEPKTNNLFNKEEIELIIVPGLAFDIKGYRVGYGKGYYDRFLKSISAIRIGLAFDFQLIDKLPIHENDIPMNIVITDMRIISSEKKILLT